MNLFRYLRTSPSSGQATTRNLLRNPKLVACHSGAAFEGLTDSLPDVSGLASQELTVP